MSFQNNIKAYERMASMTNMLGVSLIDMLKPNIKTKQNDNVIKMLDIVKDKPEAYLDLLSVAIFHKNLEIIKLIIEKYINSEIEVPYMNAFSFYNSILTDDSKYKLTDSKDNYIEIACPLALMAGIGGNIEIFNYLLNQDLISDLNVSGTIGLSKRFKNAFTSNIVGACAYYGNDKLLEYLLINYRSKLDINITSTEKKSKNTKIHMTKELSGATPSLLACAGVASDEKTIEILKILEEYKANFELKDFNNDNIFHIITRTKKIKTLKFLVYSLELKYIMNNTNNDSMTPFGLAQQNKNQEMISFFNSLEQDDENEIKENVKQLIEDSNKRASKNKKRGKKGKKDEIPSLLNSSEYQETFHVNEERIEEKENNNDYNEPNIIQDEEDKNSQIKEEENLEDEKGEEENNNNNRENDNENKYYNNSKRVNYNNNTYSNFKKYKSDYIPKYNVSFYDVYNKSYKNKNNYDKYSNYNSSYNKNYNNNSNKNNYNSNFNNYKYVNTDYSYKNNYDINNYYRKKSNGFKNSNQNGYYNTNYSGYFPKNQNNYNKNYYGNNNIQTYKNSQKEIFSNNSNQSNKKEKRTFNIQNNINSNNTNIKEENEEKIKKEDENRNEEKEEEMKKEEKEKKEEKKEEENSEDESSYSDYFLSDIDDNNKTVNYSKYYELYKKYIDAERKCYNLEQEKNEINSFINKFTLEKKINTKNIPNNEENINSLLELANDELQSKNKLINELKRHTKMADLSDIKNFTKEKLIEYKDFYTKNLKLINDTLKSFNN